MKMPQQAHVSLCERNTEHLGAARSLSNLMASSVSKLS